MSIFGTIIDILDPFNLTGYNEQYNQQTQPEVNNLSPSSFTSSYMSEGLYPWDDDDDED